jgi:hypothetical protein
LKWVRNLCRRFGDTVALSDLEELRDQVENTFNNVRKYQGTVKRFGDNISDDLVLVCRDLISGKKPEELVADLIRLRHRIEEETKQLAGEPLCPL